LDIKAITFDFWNTLANDSAPARVREMSAELMTDLLGNEGIQIDTKSMLAAFAECRQVCYYYQEEKGIDFTPKEQLDWIINHFGIKPEPVVWNGLLDAYTTTMLNIPPTFPEGLQGILGELKTRFKLAVISNTGRTPGWVVRKVFRDSGLLQYFECLTFSNEVGVAKPNPYIFELTARILEVNPRNILHIGDHVLTDVAGASGAGFRAGWYNPTRTDKNVECDMVIYDFSELLKIGPNY